MIDVKTGILQFDKFRLYPHMEFSYFISNFTVESMIVEKKQKCQMFMFILKRVEINTL